MKVGDTIILNREASIKAGYYRQYFPSGTYPKGTQFLVCYVNSGDIGIKVTHNGKPLDNIHGSLQCEWRGIADLHMFTKRTPKINLMVAMKDFK